MVYIQLQECPTSTMKNIIRNRSSHPDVPFLTRTQCIAYLERIGIFHLQDGSQVQNKKRPPSTRNILSSPVQRDKFSSTRHHPITQRDTSSVLYSDAMLSNVFVDGALQTKNLTLNGIDVLTVIRGATTTIQDLNETMSTMDSLVTNTGNNIRFNKINSRHNHVSTRDDVEIQIFVPNEPLSYWSSIESQQKTIVSTSSIDWSAVVAFSVDGANGKLPPTKLKLKLPFPVDTTQFNQILPVYAFVNIININDEHIIRNVSRCYISSLDKDNVYVEHIFAYSLFNGIFIKSISIHVNAIYPIESSPFTSLIPMRFDDHHVQPVTSSDVQLPDWVDLTKGILTWSQVGSRVQVTGELTVYQLIPFVQTIETPIFIVLPKPSSSRTSNISVGNGVAFPNSNYTYEIKVIIDPENRSKLGLFVLWDIVSNISNTLNIRFTISYNVDEQLSIRLVDTVFNFITIATHDELQVKNVTFNNIKLINGEPSIKSHWFIELHVGKTACDVIERSFHDSMILDPLTHCIVNVSSTTLMCEHMHAQDFTHNNRSYIKNNNIYTMKLHASKSVIYRHSVIKPPSSSISIHPYSIHISNKSKSNMSIVIRKHRLLTTYLRRPFEIKYKVPLTAFTNTGLYTALRIKFPVSGGVLTCVKKQINKL
jgi:hypothetical protein